MLDIPSYRNLHLIFGMFISFSLGIAMGCGTEKTEQDPSGVTSGALPDSPAKGTHPDDGKDSLRGIAGGERRPRPESPTDPCSLCSPDQVCRNGECLMDTCSSAQDLGVLSVGATTFSYRGSNAEGASVQRATCAARHHPMAREKVYRFKVSSPARLSAKLTSPSGVDWLFEVRKEQCHDPQPADFQAELASNPSLIAEELMDTRLAENVLGCFRHEGVFHHVNLEPGVEHFIIVKPAVMGTGDFQLDLKLDPLACESGSRSCASNDRYSMDICAPSGTKKNRETCGTPCLHKACEGVDCCAGNTCQHPIELVLSNHNPVFTLQGHLRAYTDNINFQQIGLLVPPDNPSARTCARGNIATPGSEMIFRLRHVKEGDTIVVDTINRDASNNDLPANRNMNAIYILSDCPQRATQQVECLGHSARPYPYRWVAPHSGDFYVVVDTRIMANNDFIYRICKGACPPYRSQ